MWIFFNNFLPEHQTLSVQNIDQLSNVTRMLLIKLHSLWIYFYFMQKIAFFILFSFVGFILQTLKVGRG